MTSLPAGPGSPDRSGLRRRRDRLLVLRGRRSTLRIVLADGTGDRRVTPEGFAAGTPTGHRTASRLVFDSRQEQIGGALYTIRPDGTDMQRIPNLQGGSSAEETAPASASPRSHRTARSSSTTTSPASSGAAEKGSSLAEADGSTQRTLTGGVRFENFGGGDWQPLIPTIRLTARALAPTRPRCGRRTSICGRCRCPARPIPTATTSRCGSPASRTTRAARRLAGSGVRRPGAAARGRDPKGDGRVYEIAFEATDEHGATCTGEATVTVPRHNG